MLMESVVLIQHLSDSCLLVHLTPLNNAFSLLIMIHDSVFYKSWDELTHVWLYGITLEMNLIPCFIFTSALK